MILKRNKVRTAFFGVFSTLLFCAACQKHPEVQADVRSQQLNFPMEAKAELSADMVVDPKATKSDMSKSAMQSSNANAPATASEKNTQIAKDKKIIKDGSLSLESKDIVESKLRLDALIKSLNGYYESENFTKNDYRNTYDLRIRIPSENFEKLLSGIDAGKEEVLNKNISARDVTEEYMDIETRLGTKRDYLKRYRELLSRAVNVNDILEIEEQIRLLQEEIESQEGRLKFLADQVAFSSLSVNLYTNKEFVYKPHEEASFFERMKSSFAAGWRGIITFIVALASVWPLLLIIGTITIFGGKKLKNKLKAKPSNTNKQ